VVKDFDDRFQNISLRPFRGEERFATDRAGPVLGRRPRISPSNPIEVAPRDAKTPNAITPLNNFPTDLIDQKKLCPTLPGKVEAQMSIHRNDLPPRFGRVEFRCGSVKALQFGRRGITDAFGQCGSYRGRAATNMTRHALLKRAALYRLRRHRKAFGLSIQPFNRDAFERSISSLRNMSGERILYARARGAAALVALQSLRWPIITQAD